MSLPTALSRRRFLQAAGTAALAAPFFARQLHAAQPSRVLRHASFGASGMAWADIQAICSNPFVKLVAVADVDLNRVKQVKEAFPDVKVYQDWRQLLDREARNLDSVNVSTPDHMHAPIALSALQLGTHVYCQKPLTHSIHETRVLTNTAREKQLVTQMGIQIHSQKVYRQAVAIVQSGIIGKVKEVHTWSNKKWGDRGAPPAKTDPVPANFDWDLWLGGCPSRPYIGGGYFHPGNWRKRLDFGTGTFGDMGCHIYDPVFKALALTSPLSVKSSGPTPTEHNWANDAVVHYVFPGTPYTAADKVSVTWYDGDRRPSDEIVAQIGGTQLPGQGSIFLGTDGVMVLPHVAAPILLPDVKFKDFARPKLAPVDHWAQFIDAVRGEGKTSASFDYSGPLTESILLGGVASRFPETTLEWDAAALKFRNQPDADRLIRRTYRQGWEVPGLG